MKCASIHHSGCTSLTKGFNYLFCHIQVCAALVPHCADPVVLLPCKKWFFQNLPKLISSVEESLVRFIAIDSLICVALQVPKTNQGGSPSSGLLEQSELALWLDLLVPLAGNIEEYNRTIKWHLLCGKISSKLNRLCRCDKNSLI